MIKPALTFLCFVCGLTLAAHAVPANRTFRFIGLEGDFSELEMATGRNGSVQVIVPVKNFSTAYPCPVAGEITLFRWITDTDEHGQPRKTKRPVAGIPIPPGDDPFLILLNETRDPAGPYPLRGIPLDDSYKTYPVETIRVINLTKQRLVVKVEAEAKEIPVNSLGSFSLPASHRMSPFQIAYDKTGIWDLAYDSYQGIKRKQRAIALVCDNPNPPTDTIGVLLVNVIKDASRSRIQTAVSP